VRGLAIRLAVPLGAFALSHIASAQVPLSSPPLGGVPAPGGLGSAPGDQGSARQALPQLSPGAPAQPNVILPPIAPPPAASPSGLRVTLRTVTVEGNTVLPQVTIDQTVAPFLGHPIGTADLEELRRRLTLAFVSRGYITSGAVLPDQKIENGAVTFRIVEGRISDITVEGTDWLDPDYVRARLGHAAGPPVNIAQVEERVQLLLQDPVIDRMNVELVPGAALGEATLRAHVKEARPYSLYATIANDEPPDVGSIHGQLTGIVRDLTGHGDALALRYGRTEGINEAGVAWGIPVTSYDTLVAAKWDYNEAGVISDAFQGLDISSRTQTVGISISQPFFRTARRAFTLSLGLDYRTSKTFLLGQPFSFTPGIDNGLARATIIRFSQDWIDRGTDQVIALRSTISQGIDILGATQTGAKPDVNFLTWLGQAQYVHTIFGNSQLIARGDMQIASDPLFAFEQLPIGGASTVRGYRENTLVRDNGYILSLEGRIPIFELTMPALPYLPSPASADPQDGQVQLAPFVDYGTGWNKRSTTPRPRNISSVGLGFRWESGPVAAQLYLAYGLRHFHIAGRDLEDDGIHFRVTLRAF
jgi:hemolysin activation/secretion protein